MGFKRSVILSYVVWTYVIFIHPKNVAASGIAPEFTGAMCGSVVEQFIGIHDTVTLSASHLLNSGLLPAGCEITWDINLQIDKDTNAYQNFGLKIEGDLDLQDKNNNDKCKSSQLFISDEGEEKDASSIKQRLCGTESVEYKTYQDFVSITFKVSKDGAEGEGFNIAIQPFYACGGLIKGERKGSVVRLSSPVDDTGSKPTYPKNMLCLWVIYRAPAGTNAVLKCPKFDLPKKKKRKCKKDLVKVQTSGRNTLYCNKDLKKKPAKLGNGFAMIKFLSDGKASANKGFECTVTFN